MEISENNTVDDALVTITILMMKQILFQKLGPVDNRKKNTIIYLNTFTPFSNTQSIISNSMGHTRSILLSFFY